MWVYQVQYARSQPALLCADHRLHPFLLAQEEFFLLEKSQASCSFCSGRIGSLPITMDLPPLRERYQQPTAAHLQDKDTA